MFYSFFSNETVISSMSKLTVHNYRNYLSTSLKFLFLLIDFSCSSILYFPILLITDSFFSVLSLPRYSFRLFFRYSNSSWCSDNELYFYSGCYVKKYRKLLEKYHIRKTNQLSYKSQYICSYYSKDENNEITKDAFQDWKTNYPDSLKKIIFPLRKAI